MRWLLLLLLLLPARGHAIVSPFFVGSGKWTNVTVPTGFPWAVPFAVQQKRRNFRPDPADADSNPQTRAGITVSKTYFVDSVNGNNANTGLSFAQAFKTLTTAQNQADVDRINIATNSYFYKNERVVWPARSMEIIGVGTNVIISSDFSNILTNGWTQVGNRWTQALSAEFVQRVYDSTNLDTNGYPTELTEVASDALCNTTVNSFWRNFPVSVSVRTFDTRAPDSSVKFYESFGIQMTRDSVTGYVENVTCNVSLQAENNTTIGNARFYAKNCNFFGVFTLGCNEAYFVNCKVRRHECNHHAKNAVAGNVFEYAVESSFNYGDSTTQAATAHDTNTVLSVACNYHNSDGQNVADASGARRWMLGTRVYNGLTKVGVYTEATNWLDCVQSAQGAAASCDIENTVGAQTYIRNFVGGGTNRILGTLTAY